MGNNSKARKGDAPATAPAAGYSVRAGEGAAAAMARPGTGDTPARPRRVAVLVAHGMGQQVPFQTQDLVAEGLRERCPGTPPPEASTVRQDEDWLHRIRLRLKRDGEEVRADVYEAYWAPLTEGRITTRDVIAFLAGAAGNGIANGSQKFRRWLFDQYADFHPPIRTVLYLLGACLVLLALVLMNSTIALVVAGRSVLNDPPPRWLSDALFRDLTTSFNVVVTAMALFALTLLVAALLRRWRMRARRRGPEGKVLAGLPGWWGVLSVAVFVAVLGIVALAGVSIVLVFLGHTGGTLAAGEQLWHRVLSPGLAGRFDQAFDQAVPWIVGVPLLLFLLHRLWQIFRGMQRDWKDGLHRWLTLLSAGFLVIVLVFAGLLAYAMLGQPGTSGAMAVARSGLSWPLLVVASLLIRTLLVQYMGDVAIYVRPYKLDRYYQLRDDIRQCALKVARAVYARQEDGGHYDEVIVVAHSLGSVVAYDVLNRLVLDDNADGGRLGVARRTALFLTFGSPLDKTAFIFGVQGRKTSEAREALAASVQPLIVKEAFRPRRWVNIHSPWDIISGSLEYYDLPGSTSAHRVVNVVDPDATTLLVAHTEYAGNPLLYETLLAAILEPPPA